MFLGLSHTTEHTGRMDLSHPILRWPFRVNVLVATATIAAVLPTIFCKLFIEHPSPEKLLDTALLLAQPLDLLRSERILTSA